MIQNNLTVNELEYILQPIFRLESFDKVKSAINNAFHIPETSESKTEHKIINSWNCGINTDYKGFRIEIRRLSDIENGYTGVTIQFWKKKRLWHDFINPNNRLVRDLKMISEKEFDSFWLTTFIHPVNHTDEQKREQFLYQIGALNEYWKEDNKLSPFCIFTRVGAKECLTELNFNPECYKRKENKTTLRGNWLEIFRFQTSPW